MSKMFDLTLGESGGGGGGTGELPELTEEHVVAYLNDKPVYEKIWVSNIGGAVKTFTQFLDLSDVNIDSVVSINGTVKNTSNAVFDISFFLSTANSFSIFYNSTEKKMTEYHTTTELNNAQLLLILHYTKTTD
mgnify:CR=1 FL=1